MKLDVLHARTYKDPETVALCMSLSVCVCVRAALVCMSIEENKIS